MNPPFATIQWLAQDREQEIRKVAQEHYRYQTSDQELRPRFQERFATYLRGLADRLDPQESYGAELCTD